ncbi:MAG: tRNA (adenosine(37)-N6)-threonylcarbamoyltransferase complex ATPase subunit type 1 TsaE [Croceivirga sp.]
MPETLFNLEDLNGIAQTVLSEISEGAICFYGDMGAGKTTLIKAMLQYLGAEDIGHSPTFGLVNEYHNKKGERIAYHFDFYRINSLEEALDMGLEEYFTEDVYIFIEWPEKIEPLLPEYYHKVSLYFIDEITRRIEY